MRLLQQLVGRPRVLPELPQLQQQLRLQRLWQRLGALRWSRWNPLEGPAICFFVPLGKNSNMCSSDRFPLKPTRARTKKQIVYSKWKSEPKLGGVNFWFLLLTKGTKKPNEESTNLLAFLSVGFPFSSFWVSSESATNPRGPHPGNPNGPNGAKYIKPRDSPFFPSTGIRMHEKTPIEHCNL